ncbi:MAG: hypothetical protein ACKOW2_05335 [Sphingobacteriaceae bacterium]
MARHFTLLFLLFQSCFSPASTQEQTKPVTVIHFPEFNIKILDYEVEQDEQLRLAQNNKSTLSINCIPGEIPEGREIKLEGDLVEDVKLSFYYETAIYVTDDGVSCDLSYWKHYTSAIKPLMTLKSGYLYPKLNRAERSLFDPVDIDEVKKEVKNNCGDTFYKLIKQHRSIYQSPCEVDVYRYALKISGKVKSTGERFVKTVIFELPLD